MDAALERMICIVWQQRWEAADIAGLSCAGHCTVILPLAPESEGMDCAVVPGEAAVLLPFTPFRCQDGRVPLLLLK